MLREHFARDIVGALRRSPIVALLGPRQSGKTTLARQVARSGSFPFDERLNYFDLEDPAHLERLSTPRLALERLEGLVVIDEIQHRPDLFPMLRVLADREATPARFLVLGSASRDLIRQGSETLAGRIQFVEVTPFHLGETGSERLDELWLRGGFPPSFLAESDDASWQWRDAYIRTFLERDIPALGIRIPPLGLRRFWMMLAHSHGQIFNASEIGKSLGVADTTAARYLDILAGTFMVRRLAPWFENLQKRQVKRPKIYFRDSGILHRLLGIADMGQLVTHPRLGASWEGFALEQVIRLVGAPEEETFFWGVHNQAELDLLLLLKGRRLGFEVKYTDTPRVTSSERSALEHLGLEQLTIVVPGEADYPLADRVRVLGLDRMMSVDPTAGRPAAAS
ncbi:MAG TPA: ATP-binding protein [Thermoanaerobaculia bacterium]|nr:ATP-binding protein [Thermoanaerobaculia bacterium]